MRSCIEAGPPHDTSHKIDEVTVIQTSPSGACDRSPDQCGRMSRRLFLGTALSAGVILMTPSNGHATIAGELNLSELERLHGGRIGLFAEDGSRSVAWRADERFAYCSTFKLFLAAYVFDHVRQGLEHLDRAIPITQDDMVPHGPVTSPAVGTALTVEQLCKATVELSDNPAANILIREMGGLKSFEDWYRGLGDRVTRVDRYEIELNTARPGDDRDTTTPKQWAVNLNKVLLGTVLSAEHLSLLKSWLIATPTGMERIKAGVPLGQIVAHKTGTGERNTHNDIGTVMRRSAAPVTIVVFFTGADGASSREIDAVIATVTRRALEELGQA